MISLNIKQGLCLHEDQTRGVPKEQEIERKKSFDPPWPLSVAVILSILPNPAGYFSTTTTTNQTNKGIFKVMFSKDMMIIGPEPA